MNFEWDERKNESNIAKHGFDFADAQRIFNRTMLVFLDDREDYSEDRWISIGLLDGRYERHYLMNGSDMSNTSRTDWARIDAITDEQIDTSDIPPLSEEFFAKAQWRFPMLPGNQPNTRLHQRLV